MNLKKQIFVYGTLRKGCNNEFAQLLRTHATWIGAGFVYGRLYDTGDYPALCLSLHKNEIVWGDVYEFTNSELITKLDIYEGIGSKFEKPYEFIRTQSLVYTNDGIETCLIYIYNRPVFGLKQIITGDYLMYAQLDEII